jgi:hypothetical protein
MDSKAADRQIAQMIDFIKLDATEKANELRVKVDACMRARPRGAVPT